MKNHLKQSSSCIILGIDIKKKKKLNTVHCFQNQHNCKLSSEMILTLHNANQLIQNTYYNVLKKGKNEMMGSNFVRIGGGNFFSSIVRPNF